MEEAEEINGGWRMVDGGCEAKHPPSTFVHMSGTALAVGERKFVDGRSWIEGSTIEPQRQSILFLVPGAMDRPDGQHVDRQVWIMDLKLNGQR